MKELLKDIKFQADQKAPIPKSKLHTKMFYNFGLRTLALTINPFSHKTQNAIQNARVSRWSSNFKLTKREIFQICKLHTKMFYNFGLRTNCPAWL